MSNFCARILLPKNYKPKILSTYKLRKKRSYEKAAHKVLVKLTPGVDFINIL
jgi:hypothetical protein